MVGFHFAFLGFARVNIILSNGLESGIPCDKTLEKMLIPRKGEREAFLADPLLINNPKFDFSDKPIL